MILKVARIGHPVVRSPARDVPAEVLASPDFQHVGLRVAVIEVPASDERARAAVPLTVLVNPVVTPLGDEKEHAWEGCLSIPDLRGVVPRWKRVRLEALDRDGQAYTVEAEGFFARVIQHECDHLEGGVYLDRMDGLRSLSFLREFERFVVSSEDE
jgi:peptide deformylase